MTPLTRAQIDQAIENYQYACELVNSDERLDIALGENIMQGLTLDEILVAGFEIRLRDEFNGDFYKFLRDADIKLRGSDFIEFIRIQYPDTHWPILEKLIPFQ